MLRISRMQLRRHRVIRFVHDEDVGDFEDARLEQLDRIAAARLQRDERRVREFGDLDLGLPDADRLDDDDVFAERVHERDGVAPSLRPAPRDGRGSPSSE